MQNIISVALIILIVAGIWKTYVKAGQPGWGCIIPFYNVYLLMKVAQRPAWWFFLMLVPLVNVVIAIIVTFDTAKVFGKSVGFGFGLLFLPFIFYPILGYGDAVYSKRAVQ